MTDHNSSREVYENSRARLLGLQAKREGKPVVLDPTTERFERAWGLVCVPLPGKWQRRGCTAWTHMWGFCDTHACEGCGEQHHPESHCWPCGRDELCTADDAEDAR